MKTIKTTISIILILGFINIKAQIVNIPDANFKFALVNFPIADLGNGGNEITDTNGDGEIQVTEAEQVLSLVLVEQFISSMEGLQDFVNIEVLDCSQNGISVLPLTTLSNLRELQCSVNINDSIDVTQNTLLEILRCSENNLTNLDISQNSNLKNLGVISNQITTLDLTNNPLLEILHCNGNQLTSLNIQNQNNNLLWHMVATNNPSLNCIQVDNVNNANNYPNWHKDETASYSLDCAFVGVSDNELNFNFYPNPVKDILFVETNNTIKKILIYNVLGKLVLTKTSDFNTVDMANFNAGVYTLKIETEQGVLVKKVIKK